MPPATSSHQGYTPTRGRTLLSRRFLTSWAEFGHGYSSLGPFCKGMGFSHRTIRDMYRRWPAFREEYDRIRAGWAVGKTGTDMDAVRQRFEGLEQWKQVWLEEWRTSRDRMEAADKLGKTWDDIASELERDKLFAEAYAKVELEIAVRAEDTLIKGALAGRGSATSTFLEAAMPKRYRKRMRIDHQHGGNVGLVPGDSAGARQRWDEIHARHQAALPPPRHAPIVTADSSDIIEGETVEG